MAICMVCPCVLSPGAALPPTVCCRVRLVVKHTPTLRLPQAVPRRDAIHHQAVPPERCRPGQRLPWPASLRADVKAGCYGRPGDSL